MFYQVVLFVVVLCCVESRCLEWSGVVSSRVVWSGVVLCSIESSCVVWSGVVLCRVVLFGVVLDWVVSCYRDREAG